MCCVQPNYGMQGTITANVDFYYCNVSAIYIEPDFPIVEVARKKVKDQLHKKILPYNTKQLGRMKKYRARSC